MDSLKIKQLKKSFFRPGLFGAAQCGALWFKSNVNGGYDIKAEKKKNKTVKVITNQIFGHLQHP